MEKLVIPINEKEQLEVYSIVGSFDKGVSALKKSKVGICTSEELAEARILGARVQGSWRDSELCANGSWTGENYNYHPNGDVLIASRELNPILKQPVKATNAHRNGKEFYLSGKIWSALRERAEADAEKAIKSGVLLLPRKDHRFEVPASSFEEYAPAIFHFRKQAGPYARFLSEQCVGSVKHYIVDEDYAKEQEESFGRACWLVNLNGRSNVIGGDDYVLLNGGGRVRGVRRVPAKQVATERRPSLEQILALKEFVEKSLHNEFEQRVREFYAKN